MALFGVNDKAEVPFKRIFQSSKDRWNQAPTLIAPLQWVSLGWLTPLLFHSLNKHLPNAYNNNDSHCLSDCPGTGILCNTHQPVQVRDSTFPMRKPRIREAKRQGSLATALQTVETEQPAGRSVLSIAGLRRGSAFLRPFSDSSHPLPLHTDLYSLHGVHASADQPCLLGHWPFFLCMCLSSESTLLSPDSP